MTSIARTEDAPLIKEGPQSDGRPNYTVNNNGGQSPAWPDDSETPLVPNRYSFSVEDPSSAPNDTGDADADGTPAKGGQLQTGELAHPWTWKYFGLYYQYIAVGVVYGTMNPICYPVFVNVLGMKSYTVKGALGVMTVWWSLKIFIGAFSDCFPIFGLRRKPYILVGWTCACAAIAGVMALGQPQRGDAAYPYIIALSVLNLFYVWGDVAMDSYLADLAQREPKETRGTLQSTIYFIRFLTMAGVAACMAFGFSSKEYGGDFSWGFQVPHYFIILLVVALGGLYPYYRLKEDPIHTRKSYSEQFIKIYERIKLNAVWRVIAFSFLIHLFAYFSNAASYDIERQWCHTQPWVDGLFMNVFSYLIMSLGIWATKKYFLNTSWRKLLGVTVVAMAFTTYIPAVLIDFNIIRSQFFYVGAPLAHQLIYGVFFIVCTFCAVEVAEKGSEGITYGLITTVGNLSIPFTNVISANIASMFHIYDGTTLIDTPEGRLQMFYLDTTILILQLTAVPMIFILPSQKQEIQDMLASGAKSPGVAKLVIVSLVFCLLWSITGSFLQIFEQTSCLTIVGGKGC